MPVEIRPLTFDHRAQAEAFAGRIPADERGFLDRTLLNQVSVASWTRHTPARRLGAFIDDDLVGLVTVAPESGWSDHVADFRLVVAPEARGLRGGRRYSQPLRLNWRYSKPTIVAMTASTRG